MLHHHEPLIQDDAIVGSVMSGAYGHRIGASLGVGYVSNSNGVTKEFISSGRWEVEVAMKRYPVELRFGAWYDPQGSRIHA